MNLKKIVLLSVFIFLLVGYTSVYASAELYTEKDMTVDLPDDLIADSEFAAENEYTGFWYTQDGNFTFGTWTSVNDDNYTYVDYSEKDIQKLYESYVGYDEAYCTLSKGENITVGGFEGVRLDIRFDDGQGTVANHTVCVFSSESTIYEFYFYVYDSSYISYIDRVLGGTTFDGEPFRPEREVNTYAIARLIVVVVIAPLFGLIKKRNDKKKASKAQPDVEHEYYQHPAENTDTESQGQDTAYEPQSVSVDNQSNYATDYGKGFASEEAERERKEREKMFE